MASRIPRACDGCRLRKVRCNGKAPCPQCEHLNLVCTFSQPTVKRKAPVRGRLVNQLREKTTRRATLPQLAPAPPSLSSSPSATATQAASAPSSGSRHQSIDLLLNPSSPGLGNDYPSEFFFGLVPEFQQNVYPVNPIITPAEMHDIIGNMHNSHEDAALVYAFATVTINLTRTSWTLYGDIAGQMTDLMQRSLASHRLADLDGVTNDGTLSELPVSVKRIMTCIFLEISMMAFKRIERSFTILREAISMIQTLKIHSCVDEQGTSRSKHIPCLQRMYWEAFIHERFLTIMSGHPSILPPLSSGFPMSDPDIPTHIDLGFNRLTQLFSIMDADFLAHWNAQQDPAQPRPAMTGEWIESKQAQLDQDEADTAEAERALKATGQGGLTELQHADLFVTRLWLRTLVWQLALSHGLLRSVPPRNTHEGLSLRFPAQQLSAELRSLVTRLGSFASIATHGSGIIQKLFEITSTVADVLALPQGLQQSPLDAKARMEDFIFLAKFMFSFERIQKDQRDYLREKIEYLRMLYVIVDFGDLDAASPITDRHSL